MALMTITSFMTGIKNWVLGKIENITALIPSQASSSNQLADKAFVNSSIATATATFQGTYNVVSDLSLSYNATHAQIQTALGSAISTVDNNDYAFVQIPTADATPTQIAKIEKYKYNGAAWAFEYELNNSGFTAAQWAAINSGATLELIGKLSALPTNAELTELLAAKQNVINDLADIRSGASAGATAVQPATLNTALSNTVAESGVYDVTANNDNAKFASLSALLSSENLDTLIPTAKRKGGMSIKFVQSSDSKYVQYRLMSDTFNTTPANWQGVDDEPTEGSKNLVKSGGVYNEFLQVKGQRGDYIDNFFVNATNFIKFDISSEYYITKEIPLTAGSEYIWNNGGAVGGSDTIYMYALIYTSTSTRRISMNIRLESSYTFTAQEGDVKAIFTFRKGFSGQSISCDGDVIWKKKEEVYGLADAVSDITSEAYREEAVPFEWIVGKAIATDGTDATNASYMVSSFIPVEEGEQYRLTSYNGTQYTDTNVYLNIAAYSAANVESFVPDALPFYFHGRFEQSIAVIIPKGVKYVRIIAAKDYTLFLNVCGCFHIIDNNIVRKINGNNKLRYIGRSKQTNFFPGNNYSVTIANRKYFNLNASYSNQNSIAPNFAILKVSAGDKFTINKVVAPSAWYNTRFFDDNKNLIKEYSNIAYTNRVIIAPEGAAWLYIAFDDNCYIGTIEEEKQDNNIENESVRGYLDNVEYDNNDYSYSFVKDYVDNVDSVVRKDQPRGKKVTWKKNENSVRQYATIITDYGRHEVEISNSIDSYIAFNTIPNAANICKISAEFSDQSRVILASQKVQMDGSLRMIKADSLINIRDLGGWVTEDGRITKYNSVFRGCHPSKSPYQITEADRLMMVNLLGITVDVDLSETSGTQTESPFGEGVEVLDWDSIAVHWYDFATAEAIASSKTKLVSQLTELLSKLQNGDVLYMHCFGGADRTGVACMNFEAILGMRESDMLKDYEMTSFSSYGLRERNDTTRDHPMQYVIPLVKACQGANLSEKWINWLSDSGLTSEIVTALRELMLM